MATIDININATLLIDDDTWYELVEACDGDVDEAMYELVSDLESSNLYTNYGSVWICSADSTGFMDEPGKDKRPL